MFEPTTLIWLIPVLPLFAAVMTAVLGPRVLKEQSHLPAIIGIGLACLFSIVLLIDVRNTAPAEGAVGVERVVTLWNWATVGGDDLTGATPEFRIDIAAAQ